VLWVHDEAFIGTTFGVQYGFFSGPAIRLLVEPDIIVTDVS
jgi:hypothetical protein